MMDSDSSRDLGLRHHNHMILLLHDELQLPLGLSDDSLRDVGLDNVRDEPQLCTRME